MNGYVKYKFNNIVLCLLFLSIMVLMTIDFSLEYFYSKEEFSIYEILLLLTSNRIMVGTLFTMPTFIFIAVLFINSTFEQNAILRIGNTQRWYYYNLYILIILIIVFVTLVFIFTILIGKTSGFSDVFTWSDSVSMQNSYLSISNFDFTGTPLIIINSYMNVYESVFLAWLLIIARCVFFNLLIICIFEFSKNRIFSIVIVSILNYLDVFFYFFINGINRYWMLPHEHSMVASVNYERPFFFVSLLYWSILIIIMHFLCRANHKRIVEFISKKNLDEN